MTGAPITPGIKPEAPWPTLAVLEDPRIARTTALIEASDFEQLSLWREHATDGGLEERESRNRGRRLRWEEDNAGAWLKIGVRDGNPVCISLTWATIGGHLVCFWEPTSSLVDFEMVRAWLGATFPEGVHTTNAMNFHNAFARWPA